MFKMLAVLAKDPSSIPSTYNLTLVPEDVMPSSGLCRHYKLEVYRHMYRQNIHTHKIRDFKNFLKGRGLRNGSAVVSTGCSYRGLAPVPRIQRLLGHL